MSTEPESIEQLRALEPLLTEDPQRYAQVVREVLAFGIYLLDRDGIILSWNQGAASLTGYSEADVLGKPFAFLFTDAARSENLANKTLQFTRANRHHKDEQPRLRKDGQEMIALCSLDVVRSKTGEIVCFVEVFTDITDQKNREARLYFRATRDALTGVYNRGHFNELANLEVERAKRFSEPLSIVLLDIDGFKTINDRHGHESGDLVLVGLTRILQEYARKVDLVGRMGGEEFAMLLPRANKEPAYELIQRLRLRVMEARHMTPSGVTVSVTISAGVAALRPQTRDLRELARNADAALYKAKREGSNRVEAWFE